MRIIDLSHTLANGMPVYPSDKPPAFTKTMSYEKCGINLTSIQLSSHTGTHLDCPAHLTELTEFTDNMPLAQFMGIGWAFDCRNFIENNQISDTVLTHLPPDIAPDYLLFYTGYEKLWGQNKYFEEYPVFSSELANRLAKMPIRGVGVDVISVDTTTEMSFTNHKTLLNAHKIIVENLQNIECLIGKEFSFIALPLKLAQGDGSPIRAIAIL